jgi:hypothetical protein
MKYIVVEYPDTADITILTVGAAAKVTVGTTEVTGGTINLVGQTRNPPAPTLVAHNHGVPAGAGTVAIPGANTGPAVPS